MKLSENSSYVQHSRLLVSGELSQAIECLRDTLNLAKSQGSADQRSFLLQSIGRIQAEMGHKQEAIRSFQAAEYEDQASAISRFIFAKFLAEQIGDIKYAIRKCDEIVAMAEAGTLNPESITVFNTNYLSKAMELGRELRAARHLK